MPATHSLVATLVAAAASYAMTRHMRTMLHEGSTHADGGGWTAVVMVEFMVAMGALGVAFY
jgi:hypothetical protein